MLKLNTVIRNKKKFVLVPEAEYLRMTKGTDFLPPLSAGSSRPAAAFAEASIARNIIRDRKIVGMTQKDLAEAAGIRVEVLNRAERRVVVPSLRTLTKIENALIRAGLKRRRTPL